jgi:LDH2 family malate/lactate/ureidoglycolate dehydrogenase
LINWVKASPKAREVEEILLPGEIEKNTKKHRLSKGIPLDDQTIKSLIDTANLVGMKNIDESFLNKLLI